MRIAILGCGFIGRAIVRAFCEFGPKNVELFVYDLNPCIMECEIPLSYVKADLEKEDVLYNVVKKADLIIEALPSRLGFRALKIAADAGRDIISVSYMPQNPLELNGEFKAKKCTAIPDAGFAPGLSNLLAGKAVRELGELDFLEIYTGGLPEKPIGVFKYAITWSPEDLIEEYTRKARVLRDGQVVEVDPLENVEIVEIPGLGVFEAFCSDGLRTMLYTLKGRVKNAVEKTIRHPGHLQIVRILRDLGLMDENPINVNGIRVSPRKFLACLLRERHLAIGIRDFAVLYVVAGKGDVIVRHFVFTSYDGERGLTAMAKITGFTAYEATRLLIEDRGKVENGVIPLELIGLDEGLCNRIERGLMDKGIEIRRL